MSPRQCDPNTTSPINRDELRALLSRVRDIGAQPDVDAERSRRAEHVVVHRSNVAIWLGRGGE